MMNLNLQNAAQRHFVFVECYVVQEAAYSGFSLACLKIRSKNEEAINSTKREWVRSFAPDSTQNETDLLAKCFLFPTLSTSILFTCFWTDLVLVLATTGNTSAVAGYTRVWIHENSKASIPENNIIARYRKSDLHANLFHHRRKLFAYSESLRRPTIAILLIQILIFFRPLSSVPLLQSTTKLSSDRIRGPTCFRKALNLIFPKISWQNMRGFHPATILSPSFHGVRKERLTQWPAISDPKTTKMPGGGVLPEKLGGDVRHASWNPYPISDQNLWFSLPYFRPDQKFDTLFQTWSPGARRVTSCYGTYTVVGVNIKREMVLSPNDEEVTNSSKKHT